VIRLILRQELPNGWSAKWAFKTANAERPTPNAQSSTQKGNSQFRVLFCRLNACCENSN
jgi:hypothetical protein